MQSSQSLQLISPALLSTFRYSHDSVEWCKVLSDSLWAISGTPETTWSYGGAFWMLPDLTDTIVKFCSCCDICRAQQDTLREAGISAQHRGGMWDWNQWTQEISAKWTSVWKQHRLFPDTPGDLTSASMYFWVLPDPPGCKQCALRL
jgi:hypothetical protein